MEEVLALSANKIEKNTSDNSHTLEEHAKFIIKMHQKLSDLKLQTLESHSSVYEELKTIELNLQKLNKKISENLVIMESHSKFISLLKNDLQNLYGNLDHIDKNQQGLEISVSGTEKKIDDIKKILVTHNQWIKDLKNGK